ncbi:MAG TPA: helix-turn-helix domain-containing protein [Bryobacteraceae bacterium]|nr:helix-turn-helix domain-containing protein [Bryobacteraceae bacterium]
MQPIEFLTIKEVAAVLKVSEDTVIRRFGNFPGVIDLSRGEKTFKRRYRLLRIPKEALERFIIENRVPPRTHSTVRR